MKKSFKKYLSLVMVLMVAFVCLFSVSVKAASNTVTYTITSATAVSVSGTAPAGSSATFKNTYTSNKQQITKNNTMTLTLSGYKGQVITGLTLNMKSNKSAGAGTFSMVAGKTPLAAITSATTFNNWYNNKSYTTTFVDVDVVLTDNSYVVKDAETVVIIINATTNSLYCESFTLTYEAAESDTPSIEDSEEIVLMKESLNKIESYMSLGYKYATTTQEIEVNGESEISFANLDYRTVFNGSKQVWKQNGITVTNDKGSSTNDVADYSNPARFYKGSNLTIEFVGEIKSVEIVCASNDYATALSGTPVDNGRMTVSGSKVTLTLETPATSVTFTTMAGQVRVSSIKVFSDVDVVTVEGYESQFRLRCGVQFALADIEGVESYGIKVATTDNEKEYERDCEFWMTDSESEEQCYYIVLDLGDLFANLDRFEIEFTVSAYVVVDGEIYYSEFEKEFSVATLVKEYYENKGVTEVEHLYNLLVERGII